MDRPPLTADDLFVRPGLTVGQIHRILLDRGHPGVPAEPSEGWREVVPTHRLRRVS